MVLNNGKVLDAISEASSRKEISNYFPSIEEGKQALQNQNKVAHDHINIKEEEEEKEEKILKPPLIPKVVSMTFTSAPIQ